MDDDGSLGIDVEVYILLAKKCPLEKALIAGRILRSDKHDYSNETKHTHEHRRILQTYDPQKGTVLLSRIGSANCPENLGTPDRDFTPEEICQRDWTVKPESYDVMTH